MLKKTNIFFLLMLLSVFLLLPAEAQEETSSLTGTIDNDSPFAEFPITVEEEGSTLILDVQSTSGNMDTVLYLLDSNNLIIAENDDRVDGDTNSRIVFPRAVAGRYTGIVTRYKGAEGDSSGDFELLIESLQPEEEIQGYVVSADDLVAAGYPVVEAHEEAEWTILAYYGGDTNLEADIINDLNEFELAGGSDSRVEIVVLLDRTPKYTEADGNWETARLFEITADTSGTEGDYPPAIDSTPLIDLGEIDTGDGETLAQFLVWGITHYPARHYAIAFGSHGAGWQGLITDETSDSSILSIPELQKALQLAVETAGVEKFDLLINDACLMSSVEYYAGVSPYFEFSLGSPEVVISPALDMTLLTEALKNADSTNLNTLGRELVDNYINVSYEQGKGTPEYYTNSLTRMDRFGAVVEATEKFAALFNENPDIYAALLGQARDSSYTYTAFFGGKTQIDLGDFMEEIIVLSDDLNLVTAAENVLQALQEARVYGNAGEVTIERTTYYNIYFPEDSSDFRVSYFEENPLHEWATMLRNFYSYVTPQPWSSGEAAVSFHLPTPPEVSITDVIPDVASLNTPVSISMEVVGRNLSRGSFNVDRHLDDGTTQRLISRPLLVDVLTPDGGDVESNQSVWASGVDSRNVKWPATAFELSDGNTQHIEFIQEASDGSGSFSLDGQYRGSPDEDWQEVTVTLGADSFQDADLRSANVISRNVESGAVGVIDIAPGSEFQVYLATVSAEGRVIREPGNIYIWPENGLIANEVPLPSGDYDLGFEVQAFGGVSDFASVTVTVDNENINPRIRGQNYIQEYGFIAPVPITWEDMEPFSGSLYTSTIFHSVKKGNEFPGQIGYVIYYYKGESDLDVIAANTIRTFRGNPDEVEFVPIVVDGYSAQEFEFSVQRNTDLRVYRGFSTYNEETDMGLAFLIEHRTGDVETRDSLYELIRDETRLYNTAELLEQSTANWAEASIGEEVTFPILNTWADTVENVGGWTLYSPDDGATFAAFTIQAGTDAQAVLDSLIARHFPEGIEPDLRTYYGETHTWESAQYMTDTAVGRFYVTMANEQAYAAWFEAPLETAPEVFLNIFEFMLDGTTVKNLYRVEYLEGPGIAIQRPDPLTDAGWGPRQYRDAPDAVYFIGASGSVYIEMYLLPDAPADLQAIAESLGDKWENLTFEGEFVPATLHEREILEFTVVIDEGGIWQGHYFATYDEERHLGLIVGVRIVEGLDTYQNLYEHLRDTATFYPGAYSYYHPIVEDPRFDTDFAFNVLIPESWQTIVINRNLKPFVDRISTANDRQRIYLYVARKSSPDLAAVAAQVLGEENLADEGTPITVAGREAMEFTYDDGNDTGKYLVVYDEERERCLVFGAMGRGGGEYGFLYETLRDSLEIFSLSE